MAEQTIPLYGALPFSDVAGLLSAAASAEKQQALVARLFVAQPSDPSSSSALDLSAQLCRTSKQLQDFVRQHTRSTSYLGGQTYIWHREPPSISVVCPPPTSINASSSEIATPLPPHVLFHLRTRGECIEDEWFALHLLLMASTHFAQHQLCITIEDEDGQFLLIEAADHLPDWVTPESVKDRVWIFQGHLHLIPPHHTTSAVDGSISISKAIALVRDPATFTRASDDLEAAAFARAFDFPSAAAPHHHHTLAYLPRKVANILAAHPQLISHCVTSIQSRDIVSARSGSKLIHFPPPSSLERNQPAPSTSDPRNHPATNEHEIVLVPVRMTRHLYAQLLYDRFFPPRQLGPQWQAAVEKYRIRIYRPAADSGAKTKLEDEDEIQAELQHGRWRDLGAKIWCGLEMAYTESLARRTRTKARSMMSGNGLLTASERQRFIRSLEKLGYFQGEMQGSARWKVLEAEALSQYANGAVAPASSNSGGEETILCDEIASLLEHSETTSRLSVYPSDTPTSVLKEREDDDSWLQLNPSDIDTILQNKASSDPTSSRSVDEQDTFQRLNDFNAKMQDFVKTKSNLDGALFEDELDRDDLLFDDDDLLFEDMDEEEQERRVRAEVQQRMQTEGRSKKDELLQRLLPKMSESEWTRKSASSKAETQAKSTEEDDGGEQDFVSSIDRIAAARVASLPRTDAGSGVVVKRDNQLSRAQEELVRRLDSQYMRETSTLLASQNHDRYDGASDSDDESIEEEQSPEVRRRLAEEYELEPDPEPTLVGQEDQSDPSKVEMEEEMGTGLGSDEETEVENLLEFARVSLGLTKEQYGAILEERKQKGRFVPASIRSKEKAAAQTVPKPELETKLDSFESVMDAMEDYLEANRPQSGSGQAETTKQATTNANASEEDQELLVHLLESNADLPASLQAHLDAGGSQHTVQSQQLEAYLRSFEAQASTMGAGAGSGPVEVLMRRFGLGSLPANQDSHSQ